MNDLDHHRWEDDGGPSYDPPEDEQQTSRDVACVMPEAVMLVGGTIIFIYAF